MSKVEKELEIAQRVALLHDSIRKEVTTSLAWALDVLDLYATHMPKNAAMAKAYTCARKALRASERLTAAERDGNCGIITNWQKDAADV